MGVMDANYIEATYPIGFREDDSRILGEHLKLRHSVELVGAKRVGISNFLRFFLNNPKVVETYINHGEKHLFVPVDLNDLVEVEIFPFWVLTFQRLVDVAEENANFSEKTKKKLKELFSDSIQSRDVFLAVENLRKGLGLIIAEDVKPTLFLLRFDRLETAVNPTFFNNLIGLKDSAAGKLAYVFTSFRALDEISPKVFPRKLLSVFSHPMYLKPAQTPDVKIIFEAFERRYNLEPSKELEEEILRLCGGHIQYLHLSLIVLNQKLKDQDIEADELFETLLSDERIVSQSEEIWDSLTEGERKILGMALKDQKLTEADKTEAKYLWDTGFLGGAKGNKIFSPLFERYLATVASGQKQGDKVELTKKENALYSYLLENEGEVCEREAIIEAVWPEIEDLGVSDWTIDRLVARLRVKLKDQKSKYNIVTVKTRGYKLTS